jgi:hypothetical protein
LLLERGGSARASTASASAEAESREDSIDVVAAARTRSGLRRSARNPAEQLFAVAAERIGDLRIGGRLVGTAMLYTDGKFDTKDGRAEFKPAPRPKEVAAVIFS